MSIPWGVLTVCGGRKDADIDQTRIYTDAEAPGIWPLPRCGASSMPAITGAAISQLAPA